MITICTRWESAQMPAELEWRMWRQLRGAFGIDRLVFTPAAPDLLRVAIDQYATMREALASCEGRRVFLEPRGIKTLHDLPAGDIVFVLGSTSRDNLHHAKSGEVYRIATPGGTVLYGINAAAIALAFRYGQ